MILGDPGMFHRQVTHSVMTAVLVSLLVAIVARKFQTDAKYWSILTLSLYLSHLGLDMLLNDPAPPYGIQLFWPISETYFIFPVSLFGRFDYFDPEVGMWRTIFSLPNLFAVLREALIMSLPVALSWQVTNLQTPKRKRLFLPTFR
jgi:inner membrane protein